MQVATGISIKSVFEQAPEASLRSYVGEPTINILKAISPDVLTRQSLIELAATAYDDIHAIKCEETRNQIISMLPLDKAKELVTCSPLCRRVEVESLG